MTQNMAVDYDTMIPNNVGLSGDRRVLKALERWHPGYIKWWEGHLGLSWVPGKRWFTCALPISVDAERMGQVRLRKNA